jgi:stage II sporulation protein D
MRLRSCLPAIVVAAALWVTGTASGAAAPPPVFVVSGGGNGHGVGMSQYGAQGFAVHGYGYAQILAHYYPGTRFGSTPDVPVRVLLAAGRRSVTITCPQPCRVQGASDHAVLPAGRYVVSGSLVVRLRHRRRSFGLPLRFDPGASPLLVDGSGYRGSVLVRPGGGSLDVVNVVPLERYLRGVVPAEMPFRWNRQALEAQAVAARSYAVAKLQPTAPFDLYADTRSQMYSGVDAERRSTNLAVGATSGKVLTWGGRVALTYYSASTGGRTEANTDAWPGAQPLPYLVSVSDPYDTLSPYHRWRPSTYGAAGLGKRLGLSSVTDVRTVTAPSGWALQVDVTTTRGERTLTADAFAQRLGLRSTFFNVGVLQLVAPRSESVFGQGVPLEALVRGLHPVLQSRRPGEGWHSSPPLTTPGDGTKTIAVDPTRTTTYRLATPAATTTAITVGVAPAITVDGGGDALRGRVHPDVSGLPITLERRVAANWLTIRSTHAAADGRFLLQQPRVDGLYRIRTSATLDLLAATSATFTLHPGP